MRQHPFSVALVVVSLLSVSIPAQLCAQRVAPVLPPSPLPEMAYDAEFFPGAMHDPAVPTIEAVLGFREGARAANTSEVKRCLDAWAGASPRVRVVEYTRSHEGRPLHYVVISDPANIARLDEIKAGMARLADPRKVTPAEAARLIDTLPGIAWLAYSIHGDETESADAALAVIHHLASAQDDATRALLRDVVVIIDPVQNPDGRDRFLKMIAEARGAQPNVDDQSLVHTGYWPVGRTNHYNFDLNRDWIYGTQPETVGRWKAVAEWNPQLFVDSHGMGSQDSYLFSPPREPRNPYFPARSGHWEEIFARDHGDAFDRFGWTYYMGEWHEGWYPGYSTAWPAIRGAVAILYEQARTADAGVRRAEGTIRSYREAVHGDVVSSMANLATFHRNARELRSDFYEHRITALDPKGPFGSRTWAVLPTDNHGRLKAFSDSLALQGVEIRALERELAVKNATDQMGRNLTDVNLPAGTLVISNRQPLGHLAGVLLDFDPRIPAASLKREREDLLKRGATSIYDVTAWNLTMMHGLEAMVIPSDIGGAGTVPFTNPAPKEPVDVGDSTVGWVADGADDASVVLAARLMEQGVFVRVSDKAFEFDGRPHARGSVIVTRKANQLFRGDLAQRVAAVARECGVRVRAIRSGFGTGDLPDLGGGHFHLLARPRVAVLTRGGVHINDFGTVRHLLDQTLAIRSSQISDERSEYDLRRYNVIIVPSYRPDGLAEGLTKALRIWVEAGGTLIAIKGAAGHLASEENGIGKARTLPDALGEIEPFRQQVLREWLAAQGVGPDEGLIWSRDVPAKVTYPWRTDVEDEPDDKELKRRDKWQDTFMPQGAILAGRVDTEHWLTSGASAVLPLLAASGRRVGDMPVILTPSGVESPVRFGVFAAADESPSESQPALVGWSAVPAGQKVVMRMSGLLWPEAAQRLANSAYVTREGIGNGQIILFAGQPTFRGAALGTQRLLMNAIVHGPGMGAKSPIIP